MSGYIVNPHLQFLDEDGKPLAYGTIETYIAGTSIAYATMKDFNGTMNPSTITLDDDGSCTIIIPEDQLIKMVIKTNEGRLYKSYDNVGSSGGGSGGGDYVGSDYIAIDQIARVISIKNIKQITTDETILMERKPDRIVLKVNPTLFATKDIVAGDGIEIDETESQITIKSKNSNLNIDTTSELIKVSKSYDKAANLTTWTIDGSLLDTWQADVDNFITSTSEWKTGVDNYIDSHKGKLTITHDGESKEYDGTKDVSVDIPRELPSTEGASHGDVLTLSRSGAYGILGIGWRPMEKDVFIGKYTGSASTSTTYEQFSAAIDGGKAVFLDMEVLGGHAYYVMDQYDQSNYGGRIVFSRAVANTDNNNTSISSISLYKELNGVANKYVEYTYTLKTTHETTFATTVRKSDLNSSGTTHIPVGDSAWAVDVKWNGSSTWSGLTTEYSINYSGSDVQGTTLAESMANYVEDTYVTTSGTTSHNETHQNIISGGSGSGWTGNNVWFSYQPDPTIARWAFHFNVNTGILNNDWIDIFIESWILGSKDAQSTSGSEIVLRVWGTYHYA